MRFLNAAARGFGTRKSFTTTFIIALTYIFTGWFALFLALPPGYASPLFPPAGIAVGAVFIGGEASLIGVFLGSLLLNLWLAHAVTPPLYSAAHMAALVIATASTLQACIGARLLRRQLGYPCAFDKARDIGAFLLLSPFMCLISASLSVAGLVALGLFERANAAADWLTWWLGDTMGILIALPMVMALIGQPRSLWRKRILIIVLPMAAAIALFVFAFIQASRWEELESLNYLRTQIGWQSWTVLTLGLFGTGLLGAFLMLSSGHAARVEMEVEQHTQALRESEERWQFALEGAGDGVWDVNLQTGEMFLSRQNLVMLGYESEARRVSVDEWKQRMHPDDLARARDIIVKYLNGETPSYIFEFRTLTRGGQWRWLRSRGKLIGAQPGGKPARLIGTHTDIDSEKHNEVKEHLHSKVMEMLARGNKLTEMLETIAEILQRANTDLAYAAFTTDKSYFSMRAGSCFSGDLRAREIPFDTNLQSGGTALQNGETVRVLMPTNAFSQHLSTLAQDAEFTLCWAELLKSSDGNIEGAMVAFNCTPDSNALPDLDHLRYAARLIELAIRRKHYDEQLQLAASVYEASSEAIVIVDADHHIQAVNPAFTEITGFSAEEIIGRGTDIFRTEKDANEFDAIARRVGETGAWKGELWSARKTGEAFPLSATINTVYDESGNFFRRICIFSDITDKKAAENKLQHLASHDTLTGLPNRLLFRDRLQQALAFAQRENNLLALMYVDLDHFKPVNDNLGHMVGDKLLRAVAERMQAGVRESDTVARIGGDEFVVLLPNVKSASDTFAIAEKIRKALVEPFELEGNIINISASIGIAIYPDDGGTEQELSQHADRAMYLAKQRGRNTIENYRA